MPEILIKFNPYLILLELKFTPNLLLFRDYVLYFRRYCVRHFMLPTRVLEINMCCKMNHSCFLFQNQPYDLSWFYLSYIIHFIFIFTWKGWREKINSFTQEEHPYTRVIFEQWCNDTAVENECFCIMMNSSWYHVQFIVYTITVPVVKSNEHGYRLVIWLKYIW